MEKEEENKPRNAVKSGVTISWRFIEDCVIIIQGHGVQEQPGRAGYRVLVLDEDKNVVVNFCKNKPVVRYENEAPKEVANPKVKLFVNDEVVVVKGLYRGSFGKIEEEINGHYWVRLENGRNLPFDLGEILKT